MIQAVTTTSQSAEFARRIAGKPYFGATMGTHCALFGCHPASGWQFYLLPGTAALALRGGTATLCGDLPTGEAGAEAEEELQGFLQFLRVDRIISENTPPQGWTPVEPLLLFALPRAEHLPLPMAPPPELRLENNPSMWPVSRLIFPDSEEEQEQFYSTACTALAHGVGSCRALFFDETPVCTVGCYEQSNEEAYMAAGVTAPEWRSRGLAGWLIVHLANELSPARTVRFACAPSLRQFYQRLGFQPCGALLQSIRKWETL